MSDQAFVKATVLVQWNLSREVHLAFGSRLPTFHSTILRRYAFAVVSLVVPVMLNSTEYILDLLLKGLLVLPALIVHIPDAAIFLPFMSLPETRRGRRRRVIRKTDA
jgi:hypothetical protein